MVGHENRVEPDGGAPAPRCATPGPGAGFLGRQFQNDLAKYDADNAVILGVSVDSVDSHKQFCAKDSLTFKLLADTDKKTVDAYGSLERAWRRATPS